MPDSKEGDDPLLDYPTQPPDQLPAGLVGLLKHMQRNADFYRVMLGETGDPAFCAQSFRPNIEKRLLSMISREGVQADPGSPPVDLSETYSLHAGIGAIVWWLENDRTSTPEQMATWLNQLSKAIIRVSS